MKFYVINTQYTQPFYGPFSRSTRVRRCQRELVDFMVQGKINRGRHTDHPAGRHSIRTNQCPQPPPSPIYVIKLSIIQQYHLIFLSVKELGLTARAIIVNCVIILFIMTYESIFCLQLHASIVNNWNSLPNSVVEASTVNALTARLDKFSQHQAVTRTHQEMR